MPTLNVEYEASSVSAVITPSPDVTRSLWNRVTQACLRFDPDASVTVGKVELPWAAALPALMQLASLRAELGFQITPLGAAEIKLREFQEERKAVQAARTQSLPCVPQAELESRLRSLGFTKRVLKDFQLSDLGKLLSLKHGANFSVPGAGKTTVTLALHLLACPADHALLVVAPKNAFGAWETVIDDCMDSAVDPVRAQQFIRIDESDADLLAHLRAGNRRFLVGYDRFVKATTMLSLLLRQVPTHLVLDEAHRIKAGEFSQRGRSVLSLAPLPVRRDILTGTPAPHALSDLQPQFDFLWPGSGLGARAVEAAVPREVLGPLYVRTTKSKLGLTPPRRTFIPVEMGSSQLALYGLLRSEALRQLAGIRNSRAAVDLIAARRCVMRLLQASTNPLAVVAAIGLDDSPTDAQMGRLLSAVVADGDSQKLRKVRELCEERAACGQKVVVWTIFRNTIARLEGLLAHLNPLSIYGDVATGDEADPETREGRIRLFHESRNCHVLIANPAACSEGISLHRVCHEAIYLDRSYNAAHYLQSIDRIHRLGLPQGTETRITILQSVAPHQVGSIDHSVSRRLLAKIRAMESVLDDADIRQLALDEEEAEPPVDRDTTLDDLADLFEQLTAPTVPGEEDQV